MNNDTRVAVKMVVWLVVVLILAGTIWEAQVQVGPGQVGVVTTLGSPGKDTLAAGFHFKVPLVQNVTTMSIKQQLYTFTGSADLTADRQTFYTDVAVNYQVNKQDVATLFTNIGADYVDVAIEPAVEGALHTVVSQHSAVDLITNLPRVLTQYQETLQAKLTPDNIQVLQVYFPNNHFDAAYTASILAAQVAQQNLIRAGYEQQQRVIVARTDANVANITAQGLANARVSQAHGYATSRVLEAQADADAQRLLTGSLTPLYVQYLMSQKWNGALPQYSIGGTGSSGVGALFSIPAPAATATPTPSATATAEPTARR